ncbi:MAG: BMP family ABC transporter substrate-binding protein [Filifactoraceae bacterium]
MKRFLAAVLAGVMVFSLAACKPKEEAATTGEGTKGDTKFKVAMATDVGGVNDQAFNQSAWEGLQKAQAELGYEVKYLESKQEADYGPNLENLSDEDNNLVWGVGFMMADAVLNAANTNPDKHYAIVDFAYEKTPENLTGVVFRANEPSFVAGYIAAKASKTGKVGFVGGMKGIVISQFEFGYRAGVAYANKEAGTNVTVEVQYADSFSDDAKGKAITTAMYANGADIVFHAAGGVGLGVIEAAKEAGKYAIGVDRDQNSLAPDNVITSVIKNTGQAIYLVSKDLQEGKAVGGQTISYGIAEGACGIADTTAKNVSKDILDAAKVVEEKIVKGEIKAPDNEADFNTYVDSLK